jgi:hypothetical protein
MAIWYFYLYEILFQYLKQINQQDMAYEFDHHPLSLCEGRIAIAVPLSSDLLGYLFRLAFL